MLDAINNGLLAIGDPLFDWLLRLPSDLCIILVAVMTSAGLAVSRLFTTDQDVLKRCDADKKRLKKLLKEAKKRKDKDAVQRHRATGGMIGMKIVKKNGPVVACCQVDDNDEVMLITDRGKIIRMKVKDISIQGRSTQGVNLISTEPGEKVVSVAKIAEQDAETEPET